MKTIKNKKVLITGGARGIGKQIAIEFAKNGAHIIICDLDKSFFNKDYFSEHTKDITKFGVNCYGYHLDVSNYNNINETRKIIKRAIANI